MVEVDINCYNELSKEELEEEIDKEYKRDPSLEIGYFPTSVKSSYVKKIGDYSKRSLGMNLISFFQKIDRLEVGNLEQIKNYKLLERLCLICEYLTRSYYESGESSDFI